MYVYTQIKDKDEYYLSTRLAALSTSQQLVRLSVLFARLIRITLYNTSNEHINHTMALKNAVDNWKKTYTLQCFFRSAVCQNDVTTVKGLIQHHRDGIDLDAWNKDGLSPIHQCCIDGNKKLMSVLLKGDANINVADPKGWTSLHTAAAIGNYDLTKYLIRNGADILLETMNREIPIDLSLNISIVLLLGTEMKAQGYVGEAEHYLSKVETYKKTQALKRNVIMNLEKEMFKSNLVQSNSSEDDLKEIKQKPRRKSIQKKDKRYRSVPNMLSRKSQKVNKRNSLPASTEEYEETMYPTSILKKSYSYDSSSSASSSRRSSPCSSRPTSCTSSSSDDGDLDDSDNIKFTILKRQHSVQFDTETLFMNYVQENEYIKLSKLLDNIEDISIINNLDRKGLSAVHWAAIKGYSECLEVLYKLGADINIHDPFGWSPLHAAVATKNIKCVSKLLEFNADVYALTKDGESVFDWSPEDEILVMLKNYISEHMRREEVRCTNI